MSIHREAVIAAQSQQVFELLTNGTLFSAATGQPADITDREGDSFSLFGGRIEGRQIELVPGQLVVQAWRFGAKHPSPWEPGVYSTVRFTLEPAGNATRLVIDHTGIPAEWIEHISSGYPTFYEDPITKFFDVERSRHLGKEGSVTRRNSMAVTVARAHIDAWSHHDWERTRALLAPDVHAWVTSTQPDFATAELTGVDAYMEPKMKAARLIEPGSVTEISAIGDELNALIVMSFRIGLGPDETMLTMTRSSLYLLNENQKIKEERDAFYLVPPAPKP
jgi:hypothetical protein